MSDKQLPNISVGNFAMDILNSMAKNPSQSLKPALKESTIQSADAPDISHISVPDEYVTLVTEGKKTTPKINKVRESKEDRMQNLVVELSKLLSEAKVLIKEMTEVGNLTVGRTSKPKKKPRVGNLSNQLKNIINGRSR